MLQENLHCNGRQLPTVSSSCRVSPMAPSREIELKLEVATAGGIDIVAHDVGTWIAHAHAANYPAEVKRLVLTESNIPGVTAFAGGIPSEAANLKSWQFAFNRLNDLPEMLIQGREGEYLAWIFATKSTRSYA